MKLNLGCGEDIRTGYVNIDRVPPGQMDPNLYRQGDIQTLDWLAEDGTVDEIVALDCIEYLPFLGVQQALANWSQKLVAGGTMKVLIPDCHAIAKSFVQGQFSRQEFSQMVLGTQENGDSRLSVIDTVTLIALLQEAGLTVTLKRYEGVAIYVEATK